MSRMPPPNTRVLWEHNGDLREGTVIDHRIGGPLFASLDMRAKGRCVCVPHETVMVNTGVRAIPQADELSCVSVNGLVW